ncbi:MAG: hypothetical protein AMXMBFR56_68520 [Polyangiaceae bacterium]
MPWRKVVLQIVAGLRSRAKNCRSFTSDVKEVSETDGRRFAYNTLADDLEYLATMPPNEALRYLRDHYR